MRLFLKAAAAASFVAVTLASPAYASLTVNPTLTVANRCGQSIIFAVRYKTSSGAWTTSPFIGINGNDTKNNVVSTNNSIIYYYAESMSETHKTRWSGDHNATIDGKVYAMKRKALTLNADQNRYRLSLNCN